MRRKIHTKVVIDMVSGAVLEEESFYYDGPVALAGGGKGDAPPPPDYSGIAQSNAQAAQFARESAQEDLAFRKTVYEESKPRQQQLYDLATQVANQQMGIATTNQSRADQQWDSYQKTYAPNELQTVADAYGSSYLDDTDNAELTSLISGEGGLSAAATQAGLRVISKKAEDAAAMQAETKARAGVNSAYGQQARGLTRMGGDPNRIAHAAAQLANSQSLAQVGAANNAREGVRGQMLGLRSGVANFGRNMPNTAGQAFGLATQAGNSAVANQNTGFMSGLPYPQFAAGGYGSQMTAAGIQQQGALGMGQIMSRDYGAQLNYAGQNQGGGGLGAIAGIAGAVAPYLAAASDRRLKQDIVKVGELAGINVYEFKYVWGGPRERGVMADELLQVAPDLVYLGRNNYLMVDYAGLEARYGTALDA